MAHLDVSHTKMNIPFLNLTKACVEITDSVVGCALSPKYLLTSREALKAARVDCEYSSLRYEIVFEELSSEVTILEVKDDLMKITGLNEDEFPMLGTEYPKLGDLLGVFQKTYFADPRPRLCISYMHEDIQNPINSGMRGTRDYAMEGYHFIPGLCSVLISPESRKVHFLLNVGRLNMQAGTPVFDSQGRVRAIVKTGFDPNRYSMPNREENEIFEIIPTIREITRKQIEANK